MVSLSHEPLHLVHCGFSHNLDAAEEENMGPASEADKLRERTIAFNRATTDRQEDMQNWLDFADFQDENLGWVYNLIS